VGDAVIIKGADGCHQETRRKAAGQGRTVDFKELFRMEPDSGTTNIRNLKSKHWTRWLGAENRCVVPFNSFSEFNKAEGGDIWFAFNDTRPLACFAGIWTNWTSVRKVKEGETTNDVFAFLTTEPNAEVGTNPPEGDAGDPDDAGRSRDLDDRASGRVLEAAAAATGRCAPDRGPRRQGRPGWTGDVTEEVDGQAAPSSARGRSSMSTWTPSTHPLSSSTILISAESRSLSADPASGASWRRRATKPASSASGLPCRR